MAAERKKTTFGMFDRRVPAGATLIGEGCNSITLMAPAGHSLRINAVASVDKLYNVS
jgi:hypothetical protein